MKKFYLVLVVLALVGQACATQVRVPGAVVTTYDRNVANMAANPNSDYTHGALSACAQAAKTGKGTVYVKADGSCYFIPTVVSPQTEENEDNLEENSFFEEQGQKMVCFENYTDAQVGLTITIDGRPSKHQVGPRQMIKIPLLPEEYKYTAFLTEGGEYNYHTANGILVVRPEGHKDKFSNLGAEACDEVFWYNK